MAPSTILMAMGMATTRLGLVATYSTTYCEPFHVARRVATAAEAGRRAGDGLRCASGAHSGEP
jgi:alkanesulfonate monooxygenase SsuD/methylene tetrahydromethanopterin reductase-like flavin-dependent oxidoreductase (luciferase family)